VEAGTYTPKDLFKRDIRFEIPTFQRPYVWNQEDQWEPLWNDVRNVAETYLDNLEATGGEATKAQKLTANHFLGAIVLQQQPNAIIDLDTRLVIDGQQRLTTLQILLDATQEVFEKSEFEKPSRRLLALVENQLVDSPDDVFKLRPTALDRDAFVAAMRNDIEPQGFEDSPIVQAHAFFRLQVEEWLSEAVGGSIAATRALALEATLMGLLTVVTIDLDAGDDSFVIFETLNARGTPLNQSDLVKNYLLQKASAGGLDPDLVHAKSWSALETKHWREEIVQGRIRRPRLDQLLNYWLQMRLVDEVKANEVFPAFRRYVEDESRPVDQVAGDLRTAAGRQLDFEDQPEFSRVGTFNYRNRVMQSGAVSPVLMWLYTHINSDNPALDRAVSVLEDYLVRRMVCRSTTKDYNRLFLESIRQLEDRSTTSAVVVLTEFLAGQTADSRQWPTDTQVTEALVELPLYRLLTRGRLRFVLEGIEEARRRQYSEDVHVVRGSLTIEHLMPQSWAAHWPLPADIPDVHLAAGRRDRTLHTIGNLTLLTQKMNSDVSNGPWASKARALQKHSTMLITKDLLEHYSEGPWDEETIRERSLELADLFRAVWPGPPAKASAPIMAG
jgi:hypothetical protein